MKWIKLMRMHHYIKNILVLLPLIFSGRFFEIDLLLTTLVGFVSFCLVSSIVYIVNDIRDIEKDRLHSTKKHRPLASGAISKNQAIYLVGILLGAILVIQFLCTINIFISLFWIGLYLVLNILYSFGLKNKPIVDIAILVSGFLIRVLYGGALTGIELSSWLILTIMSGSFYLALGKRRNEYQQNNQTRAVLKYYNYEFLDKNMTVSLALTDAFYSLWVVNMVQSGTYDNSLIWTIFLVLLIQMKYSLNVEGSSDGDPVEVLLHDKMLIALVLVFTLIIGYLLYANAVL